MRITKIISTAVQKGKLIIKVLGLGSSDVQTVFNVLPFGIDSNPNKNIRGIWAKTDNLEDRILLGILFERPVTAQGETRIYSENTSGSESTYIHLKNNGVIEMGGNNNNLVKYNELKTAFDKLKDDLNDHINKYNTHVHAGVLSGAASTAVTTALSTASTANMSTSKSNILKTT